MQRMRFHSSLEKHWHFTECAIKMSIALEYPKRTILYNAPNIDLGASRVKVSPVRIGVRV